MATVSFSQVLASFNDSKHPIFDLMITKGLTTLAGNATEDILDIQYCTLVAQIHQINLEIN